MRSYNPWRDAAARHPGVHIDWCNALAPAHGAWVPSYDVILLRKDLTRAERDDCLAHELAHVDLQHRATGNRHYDGRQERAAGMLGRARLLPVEELARALAEHDADGELAAAALDVPFGTLRMRCAELTDEEKTYVEGVIQAASA